MHVVVVGAGALGASVAWALADDAEVTVVESRGAGEGTSRFGAGFVSEVTWHPTNVALVQVSRRLLDEEGLFHPTGSITLFAGAQRDAVAALARTTRDAGGDARLLDAADLEDEPLAEDLDLGGVDGALVNRVDGWASPSDWARHALREAEARGVRVVAEEATYVGGDHVLTSDGGTVRAKAVVVAGGVWAAGLLARSGLPVPVAAYRTQAAVFEGPTDLPLVHDAILGFYLRGHSDGVLAGNGTDTSWHDVARGPGVVDAAFLQAQRARLARRVTRPTGAPRAGWAGLEAGTPDRHPLAGPDPRAPGLHHLVGGNGFGFMRAPALGRAMADVVLGRKPDVDLAPFDPARFEGRWAEPFELREGYGLAPA